MGKVIEINYLNDTVIGRALEVLADYGTTSLFAELSAHACMQIKLSPRFAYLDSTSFHLDGEYNSEISVETLQTIYLTQGYSRDHRPDLKQVILNLIVENQVSIPLHMEVLSGNSSYKTSFGKTIKAHISNLKNVHDIAYVCFIYHVIVHYTDEKTVILNLNETRLKIIKLLGKDFNKYYFNQ